MNAQSLNNDIVDKRLENRDVFRIGDYINNKTKIKVGCKKCNYTWEALPSNFLRPERGCPRCKKHIILTNDIIDDRLKNGIVYRIGENNRTTRKIKVGCRVCGHTWEAFTLNVLRNSGCLMCARKQNAIDRSLTNEIIDEKLKDRTTFRIGYYVASRLPIDFGCKRCGHIWKAKPNNILIGKDCPNCCAGKSERLIRDFLKQFYGPEHLFHHKRRYITEKDFVVVDFLILPNIIIEYNGEQHYNLVRFGGISIDRAKNNLERQQNRDAKLREYCKQNNYKLLEIPYTIKKNQWEPMILEFLSYPLPLEKKLQEIS
jgi:rubrerythrin